jgi:hypothetical protein
MCSWSPLTSLIDYLLEPECLIIASIVFICAAYCLLFLTERAPKWLCYLYRLIEYFLISCALLVIATHAMAAFVSYTPYYGIC